MLLNIAQIRFDSKYAVREINQDVVDDYAQAISEGSILPKPVIYHDGTSYWPGDGRHRTKARLQAGYADIEAEVRPGSERDAYIYGIAAQHKNGLRLTNEEKRSAVKALITDDEWSMKYNDHEIAKMCRVAHSFVANVRKSISTISQMPMDSESNDMCEVNEDMDTPEKINYTTPSGKRASKKNLAVKRKIREKAAQANYDWRKFNSVYGAIVREVDVLGKIYNRHNTEDADLLRSDLDAWKGNFKEWESLLKKEKECASA